MKMDMTCGALAVDDFTGFRTNESAEAYHAGLGTSNTGFKEFLRYPAAYPAYVKSVKKSTRSQDLGTFVHLSVLEPEVFGRTCVRIGGPMNKNPWKEQGDAAKHAGRTPISSETYDQIIGMRDAILAHPKASALLAGSKREVSAYAADPVTGLLIKCRADILREDILTLGDLKTIDSVDKIRMQIKRMKYGLQSAWYLRVLSILTGKPWKNMVHVFVETSEPHGVKCVALGDQTLMRWDRVIEANIARLSECLVSDVWPGPADDDIETIEQEFYEFDDEGES